MSLEMTLALNVFRAASDAAPSADASSSTDPSDHIWSKEFATDALVDTPNARSVVVSDGLAGGSLVGYQSIVGSEVHVAPAAPR
jgi:hypothetical protein